MIECVNKIDVEKLSDAFTCVSRQWSLPRATRWCVSVAIGWRKYWCTELLSMRWGWLECWLENPFLVLGDTLAGTMAGEATYISRKGSSCVQTGCACSLSRVFFCLTIHRSTFLIAADLVGVVRNLVCFGCLKRFASGRAKAHAETVHNLFEAHIWLGSTGSKLSSGIVQVC